MIQLLLFFHNYFDDSLIVETVEHIIDWISHYSLQMSLPKWNKLILSSPRPLSEKGRRIVFLVPTIVLAQQQAKYIRKHTSLNVSELHGSSKNVKFDQLKYFSFIFIIYGIQDLWMKSFPPFDVICFHFVIIFLPRYHRFDHSLLKYMVKFVQANEGIG